LRRPPIKQEAPPPVFPFQFFFSPFAPPPSLDPFNTDLPRLRSLWGSINHLSLLVGAVFPPRPFPSADLPQKSFLGYRVRLTPRRKGSPFHRLLLTSSSFALPFFLRRFIQYKHLFLFCTPRSWPGVPPFPGEYIFGAPFGVRFVFSRNPPLKTSSPRLLPSRRRRTLDIIRLSVFASLSPNFLLLFARVTQGARQPPSRTRPPGVVPSNTPDFLTPLYPQHFTRAYNCA